MTARERLAAVLDAHVLRQYGPACSCGWDWDVKAVAKGRPAHIWEWDEMPEVIRARLQRDHLAAAVLDHLATELGSDDMRREVSRGMVRALEDDCDGYVPLTEVDIQTLAVGYEDIADAALGAVRAALGVSEA